MNNTYMDLVQQTFNFPQEGLQVKDGYLRFNGLDLKALIEKHGTPLKLSYLPKIGMQINKAKDMFAKALKKTQIRGPVLLLLLYKELPFFLRGGRSTCT